MKVVFLGTGTSQGIPVIGSNHPVCLSNDERDKRLRTSVYIEVDGQNLVIDTGPDFRQQMLAANVEHVDAILYTHEHSDHVAGFDDIRPLNFKQKTDMPVYADQRVCAALKRSFPYAFVTENKYPGAPGAILNEIKNKLFKIQELEVTPIEVLHMKMPVFGYRIHDFTYITDASYISDQELEKVKGSKVVHISHHLGFHAEVSKSLPANVELAYDGLEIKI